MKQTLRYNQATGTWMPEVFRRPNRPLDGSTKPAIIGNMVSAPVIPIRPAPPIRPMIRVPNILPQVSGPVPATIPLRPVPFQPLIPQLPKKIRDQAKYGQIRINSEGPEVIPMPNMPNMRSLNIRALEQEQRKIYENMKTRGNGPVVMPSVSISAPRRVPLKLKDLRGRSPIRSTSKYGNFGQSEGRSI